MKRMISALTCAAVLLLAASSAMAAALGPHQDAADTNPCRVCHNTASGTPSLKGWSGAGSGPATGWGSKPVSALCYTCHSAGGGPLAEDGHNMLANAYAATSHQMTIASVPQEPEGSAQGTSYQTVSASGLPYTATAFTQIECTSCHNVHVESNRPFNQRATYQGMCDECHQGRENNASGTSMTGTLHNYSTHPTQQALQDTARANLKNPESAIAANLRVGTPAAPGYSLGGHLNDAGGTTGVMDCQACHAVHGPTLGTPGNNDLLAIDNTTGASGAALCEGCHYGGNTGEQVGSVAAYLQSALPAGSYSDHPIDGNINRTFYPTGVSIPLNWSNLGTPNSDRGAQPFYTTGVTGTPTCSSCHDTHGGVTATPLLRGPLPNGTFAATGLFYDEWCFVCHTAGQVIPNNHHSVLNNMNVAVLAEEFNSQLGCGDCHGADGDISWTAHNGFWTWVVPITATDSAICEGCHVVDNPRNFLAGGLKGTETYTGGAGGTFPATHGVLRDATGTHNNNHQMNEIVNVTNANLDATPDFSTAVAGNTVANGYQAQWTGAGATLQPICESCHNILYNGVQGAANQGLTNGWKANILLAPYEDDDVGSGAGEDFVGGGRSHDYYTNNTFAAGQTGVGFCRACHRGDGTAAPADFVHNPPAHTASSTYRYGVAYGNLTAAQNPLPYGRSTNTVINTPIVINATNCPNVSTADMTTAPNGISYPLITAGDQVAVDCDSCHRPHNADPDSLDAGTNRHLILEITDTNWGTTICAECHNTDVQCN